ncbi:cytochrome c oxidase subunit II [Brevibacillus humidisoli]|uniref:cytochrome c oxidase subunit II n=1 Tax=Brevibacillus humidisoli TaxID=2895522 RepID=UPI001E419205|nr:cytochrome c oxidase subunit II [Brevibacillus humidisoli]UFJ41767.1 cytochrome c oxidase subunit II [Brevibacillus humidisoli]
MHIHRYEKYWLVFGFLSIVTFIAFMFVMTFSTGHHTAGGMEVIDPEKVAETPPFDKPGLKKVGENTYEAVVVAMAFGYNPAKLEIPKGAKVHFKVTSQDVIHSFSIPGTNVNMQIVPGHISEREHTFDKPGEYLVLCNEYCGTGHHMMTMEIEVVEHANHQ